MDRLAHEILDDRLHLLALDLVPASLSCGCGSVGRDRVVGGRQIEVFRKDTEDSGVKVVVDTVGHH